MPQVIIITRLHAMYQRSRKILIFLTVTFLAANIVNGVAAVIATMHSSGEELIFSGTYQCAIGVAEHSLILTSVAWILSLVWEVLALCLAVWIAVKHFRELRQHSTRGVMEDCFTVLMKTHVLYFASFVAVSCFDIIVDLSPTALTTVCPSLTYLFMQPRFIVFIGPIFPGKSDFFRLASDFRGRADVCAGTTPDP
ncbi:hypothetical protein BDR06DRAFT_777093 [Suillus hirtellus]|nr:hypothetical protein BDR06DRAFT_777093 [Suillus hirtellus]